MYYTGIDLHKKTPAYQNRQEIARFPHLSQERRRSTRYGFKAKARRIYR
jgi:hypothetical protein